MSEKKLNDVIGHVKEKDELLNLINWFNDFDELKRKGLSIPRGAILYGDPGNGKTYLLKKLQEIIDCEIFVFKYNDKNIISEINKIFDEAEKLKKAVIIFDEFDLLIENNRNIIGLLQERIDGINSKNNTLILCAANSISKIPDALLRQGRIEKLIYISYLKENELVDLFNYYCNLYHVSFLNTPEPICLAQSLNHISCAGIKAIVNDMVLRNGNTDLNNKQIYDSIFNITSRSLSLNYQSNLYIAYHEAGHAVMMNHYKEYFNISSLSLYQSSGVLKGYNHKYNFDTYEMMIANINVAYAGAMANKIIFNTCDSGCQSDLETARKYAYCLINKCGYHHFYNTLPNVSNAVRSESAFKKYHNEKLIVNLLKKQERITYHFIKKHINEVKKLGNLLYDKKFLNSTEVDQCLKK